MEELSKPNKLLKNLRNAESMGFPKYLKNDYTPVSKVGEC
jgi:hypothetical protein